MERNITELKNLYNTQNIIIAGDFNAVLSEEDTNSHHINKIQTTAFLKDYMERNNMQEAGEITNNKQHTWFRKNSNTQSSRIDYIFTNINTTCIKYEITRTIFDHSCISLKIGNPNKFLGTTMKDYILSTDQFLIEGTEIIQEILNKYNIENTMKLPTQEENTTNEKETEKK